LKHGICTPQAKIQEYIKNICKVCTKKVGTPCEFWGVLNLNYSKQSTMQQNTTQRAGIHANYTVFEVQFYNLHNIYQHREPWPYLRGCEYQRVAKPMLASTMEKSKRKKRAKNGCLTLELSFPNVASFCDNQAFSSTTNY